MARLQGRGHEWTPGEIYLAFALSTMPKYRDYDKSERGKVNHDRIAKALDEWFHVEPTREGSHVKHMMNAHRTYNPRTYSRCG